jgi:hypothetical protein
MDRDRPQPLASVPGPLHALGLPRSRSAEPRRPAFRRCSDGPPARGSTAVAIPTGPLMETVARPKGQSLGPRGLDRSNAGATQPRPPNPRGRSGRASRRSRLDAPRARRPRARSRAAADPRRPRGQGPPQPFPALSRPRPPTPLSRLAIGWPLGWIARRLGQPTRRRPPLLERMRTCPRPAARGWAAIPTSPCRWRAPASRFRSAPAPLRTANSAANSAAHSAAPSRSRQRRSKRTPRRIPTRQCHTSESLCPLLLLLQADAYRNISIAPIASKATLTIQLT